MSNISRKIKSGKIKKNKTKTRKNKAMQITAASRQQTEALKTLSGNIMIPYRLIIKYEGEEYVQPIQKDEILFDSGSIGNIAMGPAFSNNTVGRNCTGNIFINEGNVIRIKNKKLSIIERLKIALQVFMQLK